MTIKFSKKNKSFYDTDINTNIPDDALDISQEDYKSLIEGSCEGKVIDFDHEPLPVLKDPDAPDGETLKILEREWRNKELLLADYEIYKIQDSDPKSKGTLANWTAYRKALRAWPDAKKFPDSASRPTVSLK